MKFSSSPSTLFNTDAATAPTSKQDCENRSSTSSSLLLLLLPFFFILMSRDTSVVVVVVVELEQRGKQAKTSGRQNCCCCRGQSNTHAQEPKKKEYYYYYYLRASGVQCTALLYIILTLAAICPNPTHNFLISRRRMIFHTLWLLSFQNIQHCVSSSSSQTRSIHVDSKKRLINPIRFFFSGVLLYMYVASI